MANKIIFSPIGTIFTPFKTPKEAPIQPSRSKGAIGRIELLPEYEKGLDDLDGFSHIILLYYFHLSSGYNLKVKPFLDNTLRGVFATRAPRRPNGIGLSTVRLISIEGLILHIQDIDVVDGTPLLDIKPYVPEFQSTPEVRLGWLNDKLKRKS
ncbi:MAG: tRNA (N6-threonylcarbamoyladenosine(37)-N6)-methyltransferase TrmO [bacterium]|jgi:tRNA-Thr(GGU) m(6)t(6)A37 methyltransferase TsaA